jgi:Trypsin-co-occurring domain 2
MPEISDPDRSGGGPNAAVAPDAVAGLAQAIGALRRELAQAQSTDAGEDLRFRLGPVEMEFLVEVTREGTGEAGVKFWVVNVGAKGSLARGTTHRLTLTLHPYDARTGADAEVSSHEDMGRPT